MMNVGEVRIAEDSDFALLKVTINRTFHTLSPPTLFDSFSITHFSDIIKQRRWLGLGAQFR